MTVSLHAFLDESRRANDYGSHLYLIAAALVPSEHRVRIERRLRQLVPKGSRRLHFRRDRPAITRRHLLVIAQLLAADEINVVAGHAKIATARHERRARVRLLATLAARLVQDGVDELVIESRGHRDIEDDHTLLDCRRDGAIGADLLWRHDRPHDEPLLWLPDALAGVLGSHLIGRSDHGELDLLPPSTFGQVTDLGEV